MSISASIQTFFPIASPKNRFFSSRPGHCRGGGSKLRTLECGGLPPLWPRRTNSEDIQLLRAILRFRSTLLRLEGTANHLFEPSNEGLVSERATRADVPAQLHRFLFRHGAVQTHPIGNHRQERSNLDQAGNVFRPPECGFTAGSSRPFRPTG